MKMKTGKGKTLRFLAECKEEKGGKGTFLGTLNLVATAAAAAAASNAIKMQLIGNMKSGETRDKH